MQTGAIRLAWVLSLSCGCAVDVSDSEIFVADSEGVPPEPPCEEGLTRCGAACVDLTSDRWRCGSCAVHCVAGELCEDGACVCEAGFADCNGLCSRLEDVQNCGACGNACADGEACVEGACTAVPCDDGLARCGLECVDLSIDGEHCGSCERACGENGTCVDGSCECAPERTTCDEQCVDLATDWSNCGACGTTCAEDESCFQGGCVVRRGGGGGGGRDSSCGAVCPFGCACTLGGGCACP